MASAVQMDGVWQWTGDSDDPNHRKIKGLWKNCPISSGQGGPVILPNKGNTFWLRANDKVVDEDAPCAACGCMDAFGFVFCDWCDKGWHPSCHDDGPTTLQARLLYADAGVAGSLHEPPLSSSSSSSSASSSASSSSSSSAASTDEDWYCSSCLAAQKRYRGDWERGGARSDSPRPLWERLPVSRHYKGKFTICRPVSPSLTSTVVERAQDALKLRFDYHRPLPAAVFGDWDKLREALADSVAAAEAAAAPSTVGAAAGNFKAC